MLATCSGLAAGSVQAGTSSDTSVEFGLRAHSLAFLRGGRGLLLVSNEDHRLAHFDLEAGRVVQSLAYRDLGRGGRFESAAFTDVAVAPTSNFVYLVGELASKSGIIARLDMVSFKTDIIPINEPFRSPSIAFAEPERLFLGDRESNTIEVIEDAGFERSGDTEWPAVLGKSVYLKDGPVRDIGVSLDGRFIVVSHAYRPLVSLADRLTAGVVDTFGPGGGGRYPLAIAVARSSKAVPGDPVTNVVVAVKEEHTVAVAVAEVNRHFQALNRTTSAAVLGLGGLPDTESVESPLLVAASDDLDTIVVGSRKEPAVEILRRVAGGLERTSVLRLADLPADIDVSPDGQVVVILRADGGGARVIHNPIAWSGQARPIVGSDRIREAQRLLAALQFPIGTIDGVDGPRTRDAVLAFQESARLGRSGILDQDTLQRIRQVAEELPGDNFTGKDPPCLPVDSALETAARCSSRISPRELLKNYAEKTVEQVICASPERDKLPVQVDKYRLTATGPAYLCSSFHSCPYVRYRDILAYAAICAGPGPALKK